MIEYSVNDVIKRVKQHFLAGQYAQLEQLLTEALSHYNNDQNLLFWLCQFYNQTRRFADLVSFFEHSVKQIPNGCIGLYIHALRVLKRHDEAIQLLENSKPLAQEIALLLAILYKEVGEPDAAITQLLILINKQPDYTQAYWQLCQLNTSLTSQHITQLEQLVRSLQLSANNLAYACYTLATVYDQQSDYIKAFSYYQQGASAKLKTFAHFNIDKELQELTDLTHAFNKPLKARANPSYTSQPVFILGMPRSGTTLVEQILASHRSVTGADELSDLVLATQQVLTQVKPKQAYPFWADNLSDENYSQITEQYLKLTQSFQTSAYFTDKMPLNFKAIGIIKRAFPNAKIIHCKRNRLDTIWGNYRQLFGDGISFSYDLNHLDAYYQAYDSLMKHWDSLYPDEILTVEYESLVADLQGQTQRMCDYLELALEPECLTFYQSKRVVHTLSNQQVRQPIFKNGINRWRNYEFALSDFITE